MWCTDRFLGHFFACYHAFSQWDFQAHDAIANAESPIVKTLLERMLGDSHEASGTIQDAATGTGFDGSSQLNNFALYYQFALLDGRRITPLARIGIANRNRLLVELRWMIELPLVPVEDDPWSEFPELNVMCFKLNKYWSPGEDGAPPTVLSFDQITSQITRGIIKTNNPELWITTTLERHPTV
ncbi:hypothetical protein BDR07DRAFT_1375882 [Suillus spraguei]|nr:hypothetical protein BDR07DRAFT_1375882 [Suillus spraguei]